MDVVINFGAIVLSLCMLLTIGILFFGILKYVKKQYFPAANFADYENIGFAGYLYKRLVKRAVR